MISKHRIQAARQHDVAAQRLLFRGRPVWDGSLAGHGVQHLSTMHLTLELRGGGGDGARESERGSAADDAITVEAVHKEAVTGTLTYDLAILAHGSAPQKVRNVTIADLRTPIPRYNIEFLSPQADLSVGAAVLAQDGHGPGGGDGGSHRRISACQVSACSARRGYGGSIYSATRHRHFLSS